MGRGQTSRRNEPTAGRGFGIPLREIVDFGGQEIPYDFEGWHLGVVAVGEGAERALRELAAGTECRPLLLARAEGVVWAWLGSRRRLDMPDLLDALASCQANDTPAKPAIAIGEPAESLSGWRLTHRQAGAALPVAQRGRDPVVRYGDVALLASALHDDLLGESLRQLYLEPLEGNGSPTLRRTLLAYLDCDRNSASAAAALGVTRQTVNYRLRAIEQRLGRPLAACASELEVALRLP